MVVMITSEEYKELVIKANKYDESQKQKMNTAENKIEKVEIKEIKPEEMAKIFDDLKNKMLGGKNNE
jgi:tRNA(Phe) wybutosine-synthesizing methylase Tyw3